MSDDTVAALRAELASTRAELAAARETLAATGIGRRRLLSTALAGLGGAAVASVGAVSPAAAAPPPTAPDTSSAPVVTDSLAVQDTSDPSNASFTFDLSGGTMTGDSVVDAPHAPPPDPVLTISANSRGVALVVSGTDMTAAQFSCGGQVINVDQTDPNAADDAIYVSNVGTGRSLSIDSSNPGNSAAPITTLNAGVGPAIYADNTNAHNANYAVIGTNAGAQGRGARFAGGAAAVNLSPAAATTHPTSGLAGDLCVDAAKRLWFCKGGTTWKQLA